MDSWSWLGVVFAAGLILWISLTMPAGQALARRLGVRRIARGAAPKVDREYLLRVCGGDRKEMEQRLEAERARFSDLTEAEIMKRAIRTHLRGRGDSA